ncbi:MAG: toprim domain-containing protein, partial [Bacteroidaceae bacterium]
VVCEGPTDWMALRMCGFRHVVAFIGSGTANLQYISEIRAAVGSNAPLWLHVFPDRDSAGQNFVSGLREHGGPLGIHVVPHEDFASMEEYGSYKDFADVWAAAGRMGKEEAVRREMQRLVG